MDILKRFGKHYMTAVANYFLLTKHYFQDDSVDNWWWNQDRICFYGHTSVDLVNLVYFVKQYSEVYNSHTIIKVTEMWRN